MSAAQGTASLSMADAVRPLPEPSTLAQMAEFALAPFPQPGAQHPRIERMSTVHQALARLTSIAQALEQARMPVTAQIMHDAVGNVLRPAIEDLEDLRSARALSP